MLFPKTTKAKGGNTIDFRKKNIKRCITKETKEIVYERDNGKCVLDSEHKFDFYVK